MTTIEPWLLAIIAKQAGVEESEISGATKLADDLKLDSLDEIEIVMEIEGAKDVVIPANDWLPEGATVADMAAAVEKIVAGTVSP